MTRRRLVDRRNELGLSQETVAEQVGVSVRMIRAYEDGSSTPRLARRVRLAEVYDWSLAQLAYALSEDGDVSLNGHQVPSWLTLYASLELSASQVCAWQPYTVHALLQTPDYATAVESIGPVPMGPDAVARRVELRLGRQLALERGLWLSVVLDESVLVRRTGGRETMAGQLGHLAEMMALPNVDVRVLPLDAGVHSAAFGAFTTLTATGAESPFIACVEDRTGHRYLESPPAVEAHTRLFEHLLDHSLDQGATRDLVVTRSKEYL